MQLDLTKEQFKELLLNVMIGVYVRGAVADSRDEDFQQYEEFEKFLLEQARKAGWEEFVEDFRNTILPSDSLSEEEEEIMEAYDEDEFWHRLNLLLGQRDFYRSLGKEEAKELKKSHRLPDRVHEFYQKWWEEFEQYGIERLEIEE